MAVDKKKSIQSSLSGKSTLGAPEVSQAVVPGSAGNDTLSGTGTTDILQGFAGNDTLFGGNGDDTLEGGTGGDTVYGGNGIDFLSFANATGPVHLNLGFAGDVGFGTFGEADGDTYYSVEAIIGSAHDDLLIGQTGGSDTIYGAGGNDILSGQGGTAPDTLYGGDGLDRVGYSDQAVAITIDLAGAAGSGGTATGDRLFQIEDLTGGTASDVLGGSSSSDTIHGVDGNDSLSGGDGNDTLDGGSGGDALNGGNGTDYATYAAAGAGVTINLTSPVTNTGEAAGDTYAGIEGVIGSDFADFLIGRGFISDTLYGGNGNDILSGGGQFSAPPAPGGFDPNGDVYYGGAGLDQVGFSGGSGSLTINLAAGTGIGGNAHNDRFFSIEHIVGSYESDTLVGSAGSDTLDGYDGNDTIEGGAGADTLYGGAGTDTVSWASSGSAVTFQGTTGTAGDAAGDVLDQVEVYVGSAHNDFIVGRALISDTVYGGGGNDFLGGSGVPGDPGDPSGDTLYGGSGIDSVAFSGGTGAITIDLAQGRGWGSNAQNDHFFDIESVTGSLYGDTLIGSAGSDTLDGFDSNDTLVGGAGADTLVGGAGIDTVSWASSAQAVTFLQTIGSSGDANGDVLSSVEAYIGSNGDDSIIGNPNLAETFYGGAGNDFLNGNGTGGLGDPSGDVYYGGTGIDGTAYNAGSNSVTVDLTVGRGWGSNAENDYFYSIESVIGSWSDDTVIGSATSDTLDGFDSNDTLVGNAGNDSLIGGNGDDTLVGGAGGDTMSGGAGVDTVSWAAAASGITWDGSGNVASGGDASGDIIDGTFEVYVGSAHDDVILTHGGVSETIYGGDGNDLLAGGGAGGVPGMGGSDPFGDTFFGGGGIDSVKYNGGSAAVTIDLTIGRGFGGNATNDYYFSIEHAIGSFESDTLTGSARHDTLDGDAGHDTLVGLDGNDLLRGDSGNDTLTGEAGADTVLGGDGDDALLGIGGGDDLVDGEGGDDIINDTFGADTIFGGAGNDTVQYSASSYQLSGGAGTDTLLGTSGADTIDLGVARFSAAGGGGTGTANTNAGGFDVIDLGGGNDLLYYSTVSANDLSLTVFGGAGNDQLSMLDGDAALGSSHTLYGGDGADKIWAGWFGMGGNATVFGGNGDDIIYSGGGAAAPSGFDDTLYGGEGFDLYYWSPNSGGFGRDVIHDSSAGGNGLVIFSGNTAPAAGFPDVGSIDNDPVNGRVTLVDVGGGWFEIRDRDDASSAIRFRGGDITVINLQSRPVPGVPGENFIYTWDAVNNVWVDQNG